MTQDVLKDRFRGCLLGCAVGDALGAPFEGLWSGSIPKKDELLAGYHPFEGYAAGQYTDDTQLSIATVEAILRARSIDAAVIARRIARLWRREAVIGPGGACTRAAHSFLKTGDWTKSGAPEGQAGNGTAMRTAVVGLFFLHDDSNLAADVADVCQITHQDLRSIAGGVAVAKAAQLLALGLPLSPQALCDAVADAIATYQAEFARMVRGLPDLLDSAPARAKETIAWSGMASPEFAEPIITPFVIPTVLAATWCVLKHPNSWGDAVASAIGLGGDVDTLGAIVGALMGAKLGASAIPAHLAEHVVDRELLESLALRYYLLATAKDSVAL